MATVSMASYPHIETNVIDESIYQYSNTRILPLQRDLFTIRAQKGRVGVLAWYDQFVEAETALGAETFNNLNSKYCSNDSIFVKSVMANNGCFIVRLAEKESIAEATRQNPHDGITERKGSIKALQILEAVVACGTDHKSGTDVFVYERTSAGLYLKDEDGNRIPYKLDASGNHVEPFTSESTSSNPDNEDWIDIPNTRQYVPTQEAVYGEYIPTINDKILGDNDVAIANFDGENWVSISNPENIYTPDQNDIIKKDGITYTFNGSVWRGITQPATSATAGVKTVKGIAINWRWRYAYIPRGGHGFVEREAVKNMQPYEEGVGSDAVMVYPMIVFEAASPGSWGNDNCLEFFYDSSINSRDEVQLLGNVQYTLKPHFKEYGKSSVQSYFDKRGNNAVNFVMEPDKIDDRYESMISFNDVLDDSYDVNNPLPWDVTYFNENWELVCKLARKFERNYYVEKYDSVTDVITLEDGSTVANNPGDGLADSDTDGIIGVDTFIDSDGNAIEYIDLNETQTKAFNDQTAYYNAQNDLENPWMVNIVSGQNLDGVPYQTIVVNDNMPTEPENDTDNPVKLGENPDDGTKLRPYTAWKNADLISDVLHYACNGLDGSLEDWDHETNIRNFYGLTYQFEDTWNPKNIVDRGRYPFNTIFDTGYTLETKKALCDFLVTREDVKVVLSTQVCNKYKNAKNGNTMYPVLNTMAQDESMGTALQSRVQLMRESIVKGTACCRATIFAHAGHLFGTYKGIVPMTLWSAIKGSEHYNTTTMRGTVKGWPNSQVDIFKDLNWVAPDEESHERHWNLGINYVQYYDMDNLHFPSIRTVYKYDTSVLLDDEFTDAIVFTKQAARDSWATYTGMDTPQSEYESLITADLTARLHRIFNGRYTFTVEAYQTAEEARRGYVQHVAITIYAPAVKRVWLVDVICRRENFNPAEEATA